MRGLKLTLPDKTSFLPDNLLGFEIIIFRSEVITWVYQNELMQTVFTNHWRIYRSSYRKLVLVVFEPTTTEEEGF